MARRDRLAAAEEKARKALAEVRRLSGEAEQVKQNTIRLADLAKLAEVERSASRDSNVINFAAARRSLISRRWEGANNAERAGQDIAG
jgi:hypothetical protein